MKYEITVNKNIIDNDYKNLINIIMHDKDGRLIVGCNAYGGQSHGAGTGYRASHLPINWLKIFPTTFVISQNDCVDVFLIYNSKRIPIVKKSIMRKDYYFALANFITDLWLTKNNNKFDEKFVFQNQDFDVLENFMKYYDKYNKNKKHLF